MLTTLAIANYRSLRDVVVGLGQLNVVTGSNGSGKSSLYRALRLLVDAAGGGLVGALAREGGLPSTFWAGPEEISDRMVRGEVPVQGTVRRQAHSLGLGFASDDLGIVVDVGYPSPSPTLFDLDPEIKREVVFVGSVARPAAIVVDRRGPVVTARVGRERKVLLDDLPGYHSMFTELGDPVRAPSVMAARDVLRAFRFYDHMRTDPEAPARESQIGSRTLVLSADGRDLAAAWATVLEVGDGAGLLDALTDAFPGATVDIDVGDGRFSLRLQQPGMLRPLGARELSDGTLRYLMLLAALFSPRPPPLLVLNEPETSLHPDLLPALARLIVSATERSQVLVITHAPPLVAALRSVPDAVAIELEKELGQTRVVGQTPLTRPPWVWPAR